MMRFCRPITVCRLSQLLSLLSPTFTLPSSLSFSGLSPFIFDYTHNDEWQIKIKTILVLRVRKLGVFFIKVLVIFLRLEYPSLCCILCVSCYFRKVLQTNKQCIILATHKQFPVELCQVFLQALFSRKIKFSIYFSFGFVGFDV